ncbi:MAG TPA: hypothetical protein VJV05_07140 [Pyrinomonadaceae bacterium]|nr:hypothetical protein [Pyrinomonadaceae bacterium]
MQHVGLHKRYRVRSTAACFEVIKTARLRTIAVVGAVFVTCLLFCDDAHAQQPGFFDVKSVIQDVQKRFRLSPADIQFISPLIQQDNSDLLVIYERFGGTEPDYSPVMWRSVIDQRVEFETRARTKMTGKQASALRVARRSLETRILGRIVQDYVDYLVVYLELEALEIEAIEHLFQKERRAKHELVLKYLDRPETLAKELDTLTQRTEFWLEKILTAEQMKLYRSMYEPGQSITA